MKYIYNNIVKLSDNIKVWSVSVGKVIPDFTKDSKAYAIITLASFDANFQPLEAKTRLQHATNLSSRVGRTVLSF